MHVLLILAIVFGSVFTYVGAGAAVATWDLSRSWKASLKQWGESYARGGVIFKFLATTVFWPVAGFIVVMLRVVDSQSPSAQRAKIAEQQRLIREQKDTIKDLERMNDADRKRLLAMGIET